jgi:hypothetical protein
MLWRMTGHFIGTAAGTANIDTYVNNLSTACTFPNQN